MNGSILSKLLAGLGDNIASEAAKYGGKVAPNELRQLTVDGIADKVLAGGLDEAETILRNAPILTRAENIGRTLGRNTPEYQNVALTTLNDAPTGFGMVNEKYGTHITALDPDLMNSPGQKALAMEDTAWTPFKNMDPLDAQNKLFIDEFGAKKIDSNREALRSIAWNDDNLARMEESGWMELNAPISNRDVLASGTTPHSLHGFNIASKNELAQGMMRDISGGRNRDDIVSRISKYLPVTAGAIPTAGILGSLLGGGENSDQQMI